MNAVMTPKKTFKNVCAGGHSMLLMHNVAMDTSHATIEIDNINLFIMIIRKDMWYSILRSKKKKVKDLLRAPCAILSRIHTRLLAAQDTRVILEIHHPTSSEPAELLLDYA